MVASVSLDTDHNALKMSSRRMVSHPRPYAPPGKTVNGRRPLRTRTARASGYLMRAYFINTIQASTTLDEEHASKAWSTSVIKREEGIHIII